MRRTLFLLLPALSSLLCGTAAVLWWRSYERPPGDEDRVSWLSRTGRRYTVRSAGGRATVYAPPPFDRSARPLRGPPPFRRDPDLPGPRDSLPPLLSAELMAATPAAREAAVNAVPPPADAPALGQAVARLRNADVRWDVYHGSRWLGDMASGVTWWIDWTERWGSPAYPLSTHYALVRDPPMWGPSYYPDRDPPGVEVDGAYPAEQLAPALLEALENPDAFAAAHLLLVKSTRQKSIYGTCSAPSQAAAVEVDGLRVAFDLGPGQSDGDARPRIDSAQLWRIRDEWHRRLDVVACSAPWWGITTALAVAPLLRAAAAVRGHLRRRARRRAGRCLACGYDLRATSARCPECGTSPAGRPS